jgi:hypothetical protein
MPKTGPSRHFVATGSTAGLLLALLLATVPAPAWAVSGEETLEPAHTYFMVYKMRPGERLSWEWRTVPSGGNLTCSLKLKDDIIRVSQGDSGRGNYTAEPGNTIVLEWANYWFNVTRFHYNVNRTVSPSYYYPFYLSIMLLWIVVAALIVKIKQRADRRKP